ncbi:MAG TPA: hypothetical protein VFC01_01380 [Mycobacterium sp.]|nr:hypothetical protein [Mycobacterium sp.]
MEIVLGVSMTPTTVSIALVEGEKADGVIVERDVFDIAAVDGSATSSASDHVVAAVLGTQEGAIAAGHHLVSTGVTWTDHAQAAALREALIARGIEDVLLVSELHAAAALAQAVGRAVGYDKTALMFVERDTATLAVVETADGSVVKVLSQGLHSADTIAVLTEMVTSLQAEKSTPQGMFVVGSNVDVTAVKAHLKDLVSVPVIAPEEPQVALARGAALAAANAPRFDASTVGLAYSLDPDDTTDSPLALADDVTAFLGPADALVDTADVASDSDAVSSRSKPFLLVGSSLTAIFVAGMMALAIAIVINIRPTADQGSGEMTLRPEAVAPPTALQTAPPVAPQQVPRTAPAPAPAVPPAPIETARLKVLPAPPPRVVVRNVAPAPAAPPVAPPPVVVPPPMPPPLIPWLPPILQPPPYYNPQLGPQWYPGPKPPWGRGGSRHGDGDDHGD